MPSLSARLISEETEAVFPIADSHIHTTFHGAKLSMKSVPNA